MPLGSGATRTRRAPPAAANTPRSAVSPSICLRAGLVSSSSRSNMVSDESNYLDPIEAGSTEIDELVLDPPQGSPLSFQWKKTLSLFNRAPSMVAMFLVQPDHGIDLHEGGKDVDENL